MGKSVSRNSAFSMINKGLSVVFPLVTVSYISRVLGAAGIGEVSSAQNLATYFSMAAALGIPSYGVKAIAQSKRDENQILRHIGIICQQLFSVLREAIPAARCQVLDNKFHKFLFKDSSPTLQQIIDFP